MINNLILFPRETHPVEKVLRSINPGGVAPWLTTVYEYPGVVEIRSVRVLSDTYPVTMNIYADEAAMPSRVLTITDKYEVRITTTDDSLNVTGAPLLAGSVEFEFAGADGSVTEVLMFPGLEEEVGPNGLNITNAQQWRGRLARFKEPARWACGYVSAKSYTSVALNLYSGNTLQETASTSDNTLFKFARGLAKSQEWEIDLAATDEINSLTLLPRTRVPVEGDTVTIDNSAPGSMPSWLHAEFADTPPVGSARVFATTYPVTMNFYAEGATSATVSVVIEDDSEVRVSGFGEPQYWDFDFSDDEAVERVQVFLKREIPVGDEPISLTDLKSSRGLRFRFTDLGSFAAGVIGTSDYNTVKLSAYDQDGDDIFLTQTIDDSRAFKLPRSSSESSFVEIDIDSPETIRSLTLFPRRKVPVEKSIQVVRPDNGVPPWYYSRYEFPEDVLLASAVAFGDLPIRMNLYRNGEEDKDDTGPSGGAKSGRVTFSSQGTVQQDNEEPITSTSRFRSLDVDFENDDDVEKFFIYAEEAIPLQNGGFVVRGGGIASPWRNRVLQFPDTGCFSVVRVAASTYVGCQIRLSVDGVEKGRWNIADDNPVKLDIGSNGLPTNLPNSKKWTLDVLNRGEVSEVVLISKEEIPIKDTVKIERGDEPFSWLDKRVLSLQPISLSAVRITSDTYPVTFSLFNDNGHIHDYEVNSPEPFRLPRFRPERRWSFDLVVPDGTRVQEAALSTSMAGLLNG